MSENEHHNDSPLTLYTHFEWHFACDDDDALLTVWNNNQSLMHELERWAWQQPPVIDVISNFAEPRILMFCCSITCARQAFELTIPTHKVTSVCLAVRYGLFTQTDNNWQPTCTASPSHANANNNRRTFTQKEKERMNIKKKKQKCQTTPSHGHNKAICF